MEKRIPKFIKTSMLPCKSHSVAAENLKGNTQLVVIGILALLIFIGYGFFYFYKKQNLPSESGLPNSKSPTSQSVKL